MSDFRHDPLNDQWISIANNRFDRPMEYRAVDKTVGKIVCPFCKGNESETPLALAAYRNDGSQQENGASPDWTARVVNNKFPSFSLHDVVEEASPPSAADDQFVSENLKGAQELVIPTSRHVSSLSELNKEELLLAFRVFQDRIDHFKSLTLVKHAMLFLNCGVSGWCLAQPHSFSIDWLTRPEQVSERSDSTKAAACK